MSRAQTAQTSPPPQPAPVVRPVRPSPTDPPVDREPAVTETAVTLAADEVHDLEEVVTAIAPFATAGDGFAVTDRFHVLVVAAYEMPRVLARFGPVVADRIARYLLQCIDDDLPGVHPVGVTTEREVVVVVDRQRLGRVGRQLENLAVRLATRRYGTAVTGDPGTDSLSLTPLVGYAPVGRHDARHGLAAALVAVEHSRSRLDLEPTRGPKTLTAAQVRAALREPDPDTEPAAAAPGWRSHAAGRARTAAGRWLAWSRRPGTRLAWQAVGTFVVGTVGPFMVYVTFAHAGLNLTALTYPLVVAALIVTMLAILAESMLAIHEDPLDATPEPEQYPPASAVIAAYLPNESATIISTLAAFQRLQYPGRLQVILAYNTPRDLPVEESLREIAAADPRIELLRVDGSTSKAQNVNAALSVVTGDFVGVFDADHHPGPGSFERAARWMAAGYDVVQGHCVVRNGDASGVARLVAVEFESIYAVSHPGRARLHGFGIFGGSNGYWRTDRLRATRMRQRMLTEDIDSSVRALGAGARIASDPRLTSYELATTTVAQLTAQRLRWAQGWLQVSVTHLKTLLASPQLTLRQKVGATYLLGWREVYPWISLQILPIVAFALTHGDATGHRSWFLSLFVLTTFATLSVGPLQTAMAYVLGEPSVRAHPSWFWRYLVWAVVFTEFKSALTRIAHVKELSRERVWRVTPRDVARTAASAAPATLPAKVA